MNDALLIVLCAQALTSAVPLLLAGAGEMVAERAGVINVGIEGLMLIGACAGFAAAALSGSPWMGITAAIGAAMALNLIFSALTVWARAEQIVAGMALNLLALGATGTAWSVLQRHGHDALPSGAGFARGWSWLGADATRWLNDLPLIGPLLFGQYALLPLVGVLFIALASLDRRTRAGVVLRALGEAPDAVASAGLNVRRWRLGALLFAGACAGLAGAYLSLMRTHGFQPEMTGGKGFLVLALVIFGRWRLRGLSAACLGFGAVEALQQHLQGRGLTAAIPWQLFALAPYACALAALVFLSRGRAGPAALGKPW